jgi:hypothetical protein
MCVKAEGSAADPLEMTLDVQERHSMLAAGALDDAERLRDRYLAAGPFRHLVLDDFLAVDREILAADFPTPEWAGWERYRDEYQKGKLICSDVARIPPTTRALVEELSAPAFLHFLETVTGIEKLLPDPYLEGGGLHASGPGATLTPHTDFHVYTRLDLYRQVNVLLYLNPDWRPEDGGALELFEPGTDYAQPVHSIDPVWGRLVIFRTDDRSPHGSTKPVAHNRFRRSIALYYYTAHDTGSFAGDTNTYWKTHGVIDTRARRLRMATYKGLLNGSRALSMLAHRSNPNLGSRVRPESDGG